MAKIREWLTKLQGTVDTHDKRLDKVEELMEWGFKLIIGTIFTIMGGVIIFLFTKKV